MLSFKRYLDIKKELEKCYMIMSKERISGKFWNIFSIFPSGGFCEILPTYVDVETFSSMYDIFTFVC